MIPVRLKLTDFLSYRGSTEIDFTGFAVACLTGVNGSGKSSILDSICYALFGAARGCEGGQNAERLINDAADKTSVELAFELGDDTYRIVRTKSRGGRGDVRLMARSGDGWTNLAGESVRETEARIGDLLRMDYQTFTASAFLLQGRADDFLRLPPDKRKDVLVRLLDLGVYERLEESVRGHARDAQVRQKTLAGDIDRLAPVPAELASVTAELAAARLAADAADVESAAADGVLEERRMAHAKLEAEAQVVEREQQAADALAQRLQDSRAALGRKGADIATIDELLAREPKVRETLDVLDRLEVEDAALQDASRSRGELTARREKAAGAIEAERRELAATVVGAVQQADALDREADVLAREQDTLAEREALAAELGDAERTSAEVRTQLQAMHAEGATLTERLKTLEERRTDTAEKLSLIASGDGACPLCGGELGPAHRKTLTKQIRDDEAKLRRETRDAEARRDEVRKEWKRLREELDRLEKALVRRATVLEEIAALQARVALVPERRQKAGALRATATAIDTRLAEGTFAEQAREELAAVDALLVSTPYDAAAHKDLRTQVQSLRPARDLAVRIDEGRSRRDAVAGERDELVLRIAADERELEERRERASLLGDVLARVAASARAVEDARQVWDRARASASATRTCVATLTEREDGLRRQVAELERLRSAELEVAGEFRRYGRLSQAFGRGGIPDLILENSLPELTHEANDILGRLSDYEMSVHFEMSRNLKSGKARDTFDVKVHHDGGDRDFQMFSGGEAFRIAFAIRLGLSKLLVRRAGARLETLVIDEGFGTQDAQGRERLVEAINLARQEFRKVLVISHIDELKDAFTTQLSVSKDASRGSVVAVVSS